MKPLLALLLLATLQGVMPAAAGNDSKKYAPISLTMTEAPGYFRSVSVGIPDGRDLEVQIEAIDQNPTKKWSSTAFVALFNDDTSVAYYLNLSTDRDLQKQYIRARLVDKELEKEISNYTHQELFSLQTVVTIKVHVNGKNLSSYINDTLIETRELPFEPTYYDLGVSSGSYRLTVLDDVPPPAPESDAAGYQFVQAEPASRPRASSCKFHLPKAAKRPGLTQALAITHACPLDHPTRPIASPFVRLLLRSRRTKVAIS